MLSRLTRQPLVMSATAPYGVDRTGSALDLKAILYIATEITRDVCGTKTPVRRTRTAQRTLRHRRGIQMAQHHATRIGLVVVGWRMHARVKTDRLLGAPG